MRDASVSSYGREVPREQRGQSENEPAKTPLARECRRHVHNQTTIDVTPRIRCWKNMLIAHRQSTIPSHCRRSNTPSPTTPHLILSKPYPLRLPSTSVRLKESRCTSISRCSPATSPPRNWVSRHPGETRVVNNTPTLEPKTPVRKSAQSQHHHSQSTPLRSAERTIADRFTDYRHYTDTVTASFGDFAPIPLR